jgi:general stress protein 26
MYETPEEMARLQALLDASHARATEHLRDIIHGDRVLSAQHLVALLTGMKVLSLATVTARCEPRVSAVDGHFLHGSWSFSTSGTAAKARHMRDRPSVSVAHVDHEELAVFSHGTVEALAVGDADYDETLAHWTRHYGSSPLSWGEEVRIYRYRPTWMVGYAWKRDEVLARRGITPAT